MTSLANFFRRNPHRWSYATWCSIEKGFLYVENPKVACTTIKQVLQVLSGFQLPPNEQAIHYRSSAELFVPNIFEYIDELEIRDFRGVYIFSIVRDPATRLISAYKDKILRSKGKFWENYRREIRDMHCLEGDVEISIEHFVDYVEAKPDQSRDPHWRSQYALLNPNDIPYHRIGRFERFEDDFREIIGNIAPEDSTVEVLESNSTDGHLNLGVEMSALCARIRSIYSNDCEFFGY